MEKIKKVLRFLPLVLILLPFFVQAQTVFPPWWGDPQYGLIPSSCQGANCDLCDLAKLGQNVTYFGINLVVWALAPIFILWGAIMMIFSAGSPQRMGQGKKIITSALIGLALGLGAFMIVNTFFWVISGTIGTGNGGNSWSNIICNP